MVFLKVGLWKSVGRGNKLFFGSCVRFFQSELDKMLSLPAAIFLFFSFAIGQTRATFRSNQCVNYASYNETTALCQCDPGYKGLGDLCCVSDDEYHNCNIGGDPWITSYDGTRIPLSFPCLGRVAVVTGTSSRGNECRVELISTGKMVQNGAIYPDRIVVSFSIQGQETQYFKIVGDTIHRPGDPAPLTFTQLYGQRKTRMSLQSERIQLKYTSPRKIWSITGCNTQINFRPAADDKAIQFPGPGMCVSVLKSSPMTPSGDISNGDVCSVSSTTSTLTALPADTLKGFVKDLKLLNTISSVQGEYQDSCESIRDEAETCGSARDQAVTSCIALFYNTPLRLCLSAGGMSGPQIVSMFSKCMAGYCNSDPSQCTTLLAGLPVLKSCFPSFCNRPPVTV